eukprot:365159-Chlamydomonas_euryale.AAC.10
MDRCVRENVLTAARACACACVCVCAYKKLGKPVRLYLWVLPLAASVNRSLSHLWVVWVLCVGVGKIGSVAPFGALGAVFECGKNRFGCTFRCFGCFVQVWGKSVWLHLSVLWVLCASVGKIGSVASLGADAVSGWPADWSCLRGFRRILQRMLGFLRRLALCALRGPSWCKSMRKSGKAG